MSRPKLELFLYPWELLSMPDYSCTLPGGTTLGKFWRRCGRGSGGTPRDDYALEAAAAGCYSVGCYYAHVPDDSPRARAGDELTCIAWFVVVLRAGPAPRAYSPPDWSNHQQWRRENLERRT